MLKKINLLLFLVMPLIQVVLNFLFFEECCGEAHAQVVIKDKIVIDSPDEEFLVTPFYGGVYINFDAPVQKLRATFKVGLLQKFLNEITDQTYDCNCGYPLWDLNAEWTFYDVPAGKLVDLEVLQCQQIAPPPPPGGTCDWVELPVEFNADPQIQNKWNIGIDVNYPNTPPDWRYTGYITFTEMTPPGCDPQFDCTEEYFLPSIVTTQQPAGYEGIVCKDNCQDWALFNVPLVDNGYLYSINDVCFNKQLQGWWFNLDDNHSFIINYVMEFCSSNVICAGKEILENYNHFPPEYGCENIIKDIQAHYSYGAEDAHYFLKDIFMEHEKIHRAGFMEIVSEYKHVLDDQLLSNLKECEYFSSKEEAMTFWETKINEIYTGWHTLVVGNFNDKTGGWPWSDPLKRPSYELLTQMLTQPYIFNILDSARVYFHCN